MQSFSLTHLTYRRSLFKFATTFLTLLTMLMTTAAEGRKPNIIFILMDDMGYSDVSCYGATGVDTPNIDRLAKNGLQFTNFHSGASICSPSRAAYLTGAYPQRCGLYMGINENREPHWFLGLNPDEITLAELCLSQGYKTLMIGKWHLGTEEQFSYYNQGFEHYYGAPSNIHHNPEFFDDKEQLYANTPLEQLASLYTNKVIEHVRTYKDQPFFLFYSHQYPHTPYKCSKKWKGSSRSGVRGDALQEVDWGIGQMIDTLEEEGILDNTMIIFASDNGAISNKHCLPFRGTKYVTFEGGHRVPFIIHYPALIHKAAEVDQLTTAMDLFPTVAELIGTELPSDRLYDGMSLKPLLQGELLTRSQEEPFYYYNCENLQAVKKGDWKIHLPREKSQVPFWEHNKEFIGMKKPILYHLKNDINEQHNVAAQYPKIVAELTHLAEQQRKHLGEFQQRGDQQRATGSLFPEVPVVSHQKDWYRLSESIKGRGQSEFTGGHNKH